MKLKVIGNALIVTSKLTEKQFKAAVTYNPSFLTVVDDEGNEVFSIRKPKDNIGSINRFGVSFNGVSSEGELQLTLVIPQVENKINYVKERYGIALAALAEAEELIATAINEATEELDILFEGMEVE